MIVAHDRKIPGRCRHRSDVRKVRDLIGVAEIIRLQTEHTDRFGVHDSLIVVIQTVFVERKTYAAAGNEHGMFERPASLRGSFRIIVNAVARMHVTDDFVQERIGLLRIVRRLQMAGQYIIISTAGIRRRQVVQLAAFGIGDRHVRALALKSDGDQFGICGSGRFIILYQPEVVTLGSYDGTAHFPDQVIVQIRIRRLGAPVGLPLGPAVVLLLRCCFLFLGDLGGRVDVNVYRIALLGMRFSVTADGQSRLKVCAGMAVRGSGSVRIVIPVVIRALVRTVADFEVSVLRCGTRQPVVHDYLVRFGVDVVYEHIVLVQSRIVFVWQRHFEIVRRITVLIYQNGGRYPDLDLIRLEVFKFTGH